MNVSITFEPSGISGLVAQGTYLIDAARRMGAPLGAGCLAGKGDCPSCIVAIKAGESLLSPPTGVENKLLGIAGLTDSLRMACQAKIEGQGDIVLMVTAFRPQEAPPIDLPSDIEKKFGGASCGRKAVTINTM